MLFQSQKKHIPLYFTRKTFVSFFIRYFILTRSTQTLDQFNVYQMLQVLSYQFVDKAKQMGGKRTFHFIANGYAQSKFHPKAPGAEYRTRKKVKSDE